MINPIIVERWEKNKKSFHLYLKQVIAKGGFIYMYENLVKLIIREIINKGLHEKEGLQKLDSEEVTVIQLGAWNGEIIFVIKPENDWVSKEDCWITSAYYGSCGPVDAMIDAETKSEVQEKTEIIYKLSLDIIENFRPLSELYR